MHTSPGATLKTKDSQCTRKLDLPHFTILDRATLEYTDCHLRFPGVKAC